MPKGTRGRREDLLLGQRVLTLSRDSSGVVAFCNRAGILKQIGAALFGQMHAGEPPSISRLVFEPREDTRLIAFAQPRGAD